MRIDGLTVRVAGKTLLERASAEIPAGRVTLLVGASGTGKSVLLRVLAGLIEPGAPTFEVTGHVQVGDVEVVRSAREGGPSEEPTRPRGRAVDGSVGVVFQSFALLDELSPEDNIRFAMDHRAPGRRGGRPTGAAAAPRTLLEEFRVPVSTPVSALSGGQKQRLAIARTLAHDAPIVIYDEPTSGLDPHNSLRVARRIRETCDAHQKTTLVVTHDYESLAAIADRVYLLDASSRSLVEVDPGKLGELKDALETSAPQSVEAPPAGRPFLSRCLPWTLGRLEASGRVVEGAWQSLLALVPIWRSVRWGLRYLRHYLGLVASPASCLYFASAGVIAGFVSTHFIFKFLPHRSYTEPLIADDLLAGLGFALYRILAPVLLTILIAARCGAAVSADIGARVYSQQFDALRSMGARPSRYLLTNILYSFIVGAPLLVGIGFLAARYTSLFIYVYNFPEHGPAYWDANFFRDLRIPGVWLYRGTAWLVAKTVLCGLGVGAVAYHLGARPKSSGVETSRAVTGTIIAATLLVLLVHFVFAFLEF